MFFLCCLLSTIKEPIHRTSYITFSQAAAMKNKFWMENLKAIIAGSVVGLLVLGLIYWKFFMPQPPPPGYGPPPGGAAGGQGSTTQTRSHGNTTERPGFLMCLPRKHTTPHIQNHTITQKYRQREKERERRERETNKTRYLSCKFSRLRTTTSSSTSRGRSSSRGERCGRRRCRR